MMNEVEGHPKFHSKNGEKERKRKRPRSSGVEMKVPAVVKPKIFNEKARLKKPMVLKKQSTLDRYSFSYERASHLRPIIRQNKSDRRPSMDSARRLLFQQSKDIVVDITPLIDKPVGVVRMPEDSETNDENTESPCIDEARECSMFSPQIAPVEIAPIALNFVSCEKVDETRVEIEAAAKVELPVDWSVEEGEIFEKGLLSSKNTADLKNKLWSSVFEPASKKEFLGNAMEVERFYSWLETWKKRLSWQMRPKAGDHRRRRKKYLCEDSEYIENEIANPFVVTGPCGSGKTAIVYCAAKETKIRVVEFSSSDRRNGSILQEKLAGAIDNHCVNKERKLNGIFGATSTTSFSPMVTSVRSLNSSADFSLVLFEDCDVIYAHDEHFWSALKDLCKKSKIPIVLTCSDPSDIKEMLLSNPPATYESIHLKLPSAIRIAEYLRPWVCGYSNKLLTISWLKHVVEECRCDFRAVLNSIQARVPCDSPSEFFRCAVVEMSIKTHLSRVSMLSGIDAAYGRTCSITWRAKLSMDLDYVPDDISQYLPWTRDSDGFEEPVQSMLQPYFQDMCLNTFPSLNDSLFQPNQPVKDAWQRSSTMLNSCNHVALDYLPALRALDDRFYRETSQMRDKRGTIGRSRIQHPFDVACRKSGLLIDENRKLRHSITKYSFSASCEPGL